MTLTLRLDHVLEIILACLVRRAYQWAGRNVLKAHLFTPRLVPGKLLRCDILHNT